MAKLEKQFGKRNFALGAIYLSAAGRDEIEGLPSPKDLCAGYFKQYKRKVACFRDIQSYVANLPMDQQTLFLEEIAKQSEDEEVISCILAADARHHCMKYISKSTSSSFSIC